MIKIIDKKDHYHLPRYLIVNLDLRSLIYQKAY